MLYRAQEKITSRTHEEKYLCQFGDRGGNEGDEMVGRKDKRFRNDGHLYGH